MLLVSPWLKVEVEVVETASEANLTQPNITLCKPNNVGGNLLAISCSVLRLLEAVAPAELLPTAIGVTLVKS